MESIKIDSLFIQNLLSKQFPQWSKLPIVSVEPQGWDNRVFRLGKNMLIRVPSAACYASQVIKEQKWLAVIAPKLTIEIPEPIAMGKPDFGYPWNWSIYKWIKGETAAMSKLANSCEFARDLAQFLMALHKIDAKDGPLPGKDNFYRGGSLEVYDEETKKAIFALKGKIDEHSAAQIWDAGVKTSWSAKPLWVHGDISSGNLLVKESKLHAVIDFGMLCIGDPACDLSITWTYLEGKAREVFKQCFSFCEDTWARARAWTLWKALIIAAGFVKSNSIETENCWGVISKVIEDHKNNGGGYGEKIKI